MAKQKYKVVVPPNRLTEGLAYWLGFLLADGNLYRQGQRSWRTTINLAKRDKKHLQLFLDFLQSDYPIYDNPKTRSCGVIITSELLGELLMNYGITPCKSKTVTVDDRLASNRHFWRGVFDGDGYLGKTRVRFGLSGTYDVCDKFTRFLDLGLNVHQRGDNFYIVETCGSKARLVASRLYYNVNIALERKARLAGGYSHL